MKKFYILASAILALSVGRAQDESINHLINFEDLTLEEESFYNGADQAGGFETQGVFFGNDFNEEWGSWSGFGYSNMTDTETAGFENQYSAIPGSGAEGSEQYGVYNSGMTENAIELVGFPTENSDSYALTSFSITNTTYAYLSMKEGDAFAKQFGSPLNAEGEEDGTDGKDFFYVTVNGLDEEGEVQYTKDVYLADFRSDNEEDHFILKEWKTIHLEEEWSNIAALTFEFTSSDNGEFGMNTPAYFAIDNIEIQENTTVSVNNELSTIFSMYPNPATSKLVLDGEEGAYEIYDAVGKIVQTVEVNNTTVVDVAGLTPGVYFVKNKDLSTSTAQKLIIQ